MDMRAENWKQGLDEGILDTWPAQELFCIDEAWWATNSAEWQRKWVAAGGRLFEGRMIALKNDPMWKRLSPAKKFYPPFHKEDLLETQDVERNEAEAFGLITSAEVLDPKAFEQDIPTRLTMPL